MQEKRHLNVKQDINVNVKTGSLPLDSLSNKEGKPVNRSLQGGVICAHELCVAGAGAEQGEQPALPGTVREAAHSPGHAWKVSSNDR